MSAESGDRESPRVDLLPPVSSGGGVGTFGGMSRRGDALGVGTRGDRIRGDAPSRGDGRGVNELMSESVRECARE